jgi:hypothetical protein
MLDRAYTLAEALIARLDRVIALLEKLLNERDHAGR